MAFNSKTQKSYVPRTLLNWTYSATIFLTKIQLWQYWKYCHYKLKVSIDYLAGKESTRTTRISRCFLYLCHQDSNANYFIIQNNAGIKKEKTRPHVHIFKYIKLFVYNSTIYPWRKGKRWRGRGRGVMSGGGANGHENNTILLDY